MTQIQAGERARFPHRRNLRGSLRERRSGMGNGVCQEKPNKVIYARPCDFSSRGSQETPVSSAPIPRVPERSLHGWPA